MGGRRTISVVEAVVVAIFCLIPVALCVAEAPVVAPAGAPAVAPADAGVIPSDKSQLESWFASNIKPLADRKAELDPAVVAGDQMAMIAAHAKDNPSTDSGYSFVHCSVTGTGGIAFLARAWKSYASVVYAYCQLSDVVNPQGWSDNNKPGVDKTVFFGEYQNSGPGADMAKRVPYTKKLTGDNEAKPFITLGFIQASKWLLPPTTI